MVDVSKAQDGGIIKKILTEGSGDTPSTGNEVKVHYTGRLLDGTVFDSSKDRNEFFKFKVGTGQVIKGWDEGILTMKRGEVAILTCQPDYAYGASGSPPKIPPNSTLEFEVEMHDFYGEDCSGDGGVLKSVTKEGTGLSNPRDGATVSVTWTMKHLDRDLETRTVKFILGDGAGEGVVAGVEKALLKMKKGESASVTVKSPYAYGHVGDGKLAVPGGADLVYQLTLEDFEQAKYKHEMTNAEKLEFSEKAKERGTEYFKAGKFDLALKKYKVITEYLEADAEDFDDMPSDSDDEDKDGEVEKKEEKDPEHDKKSQQLLLAGFSNQALCHLKLMDGISAFKACENALKLDPQNVKALFRRGQSAEMSQEWEDAIGYFKAVLEVDPKNTAAANRIKFCRNKVMTYKQAQKKKYANMFERTNFKDPEPTKDDNKTKPDFSDSEEDEEAIGSDGEKPQEMEV